MAHKKKLHKQNSNQFLFTKKRIIFLALFVIFGSVILFARAESSKKVVKDSRPRQNLIISYVDEKPSTVIKSNGGNLNFESRARSIEISSTGTIYCTPEDNGSIAKRQLNTEEQLQVKSQIDLAKDQSLPREVKIQGNGEGSVNNYVGLVIRDTAVSKNSAVFNPKLESAYFKSTIKLLEALCKPTTTPIQPKDLPRWDYLDPATSKPAENPPSTSSLVAPKVEASDASGYGLDVNAENWQHLSLAGHRQRNGLAATTRTECLDNAARSWASTMAKDKIMRHSSPINYLPELFCGTGWSKIGENVGVQRGLQLTTDQQYSYQISENIFKAFVASPGHNANLLDPAFTKHGMGAYKTPDGTELYIAQLFWRGNTPK